MGSRRLLLAVSLAVLALVAPASAANIATPKMAAVASWAAGKPLTVVCEDDGVAWDRLLASRGHAGQPWAGFTNLAEPVVYIGPSVRAFLADEANPRFGIGLNVLLHEAFTHARGGIRDNAVQECGALVLQYSALHDFYGVLWRSRRMWEQTELAVVYSRAKPADYQNGCSRL